MPALKKTDRIRKYLFDNKALFILICVLLLERVIALIYLGTTYSLNSDDMGYFNSGVNFANTGTITMYSDYPTGQIMPGMTYFIGLLSLVFGEGNLLWLVLKIIWICMGSFTAFFICKSVTIFMPKWCGIVASLPLLAANFVWMDNIILTETPFILLFTAMVYYTLKLGRTGEYKYFWGCLVSYFLAMLLKANIAVYPIFALVYLIVVKYDIKRLLKQAAILVCAVLCFIVPWTIRNYIDFDTIIPLTFGAGNPRLLGTYQGYGYPLDEELDYETNVEKVVKENYSKYYNEDGTVKPEFDKYISLEKDGVKASYRQKEWAKRSPVSMVLSYLFIKPHDMINYVFYWEQLFGISGDRLLMLQYINTHLCTLAVLASVIMKQNRKEILYLLVLYAGNIFIYCSAFAFDRYNTSLMTVRYILFGISIGAIMKLIQRGVEEIKTFKQKQ